MTALRRWQVGRVKAAADPLAAIDQAKCVQDLVRLVEIHCINKSAAALSTQPLPAAASVLSFSHLAVLCTRLAAFLEAQAHPGLSPADAMAVSHKLLDQVSTDLTDCPSAPITLQDLVQFLDVWARVGYIPSQALRSDVLFQLSPEGGNNLADANAKELASMAWSLQKLGWADQQLVNQLAGLAGQRAPDFDPDTLSLFTGVLRRAHKKWEQKTFLPLATASRPLLPVLTPSELAMLLFTLVRADAHNTTLFSAAAVHILPHIRTVMPRDLAFLASAYAQAGLMHKQLFRAMAATATQHADCMDRKEMAWLVRAYGMLRLYDAPMFSALADATERYLRVTLPREKKQQFAIPTTRQRLVTEMHTSVDMGISDRSDPIHAPTQLFADLADLVWGFARMGHYSPSLFEAVGAVAAADIHSFDCGKLGQLMWAFQHVRHRHPELLQAAAAQAVSLGSYLADSLKHSTLPPWTSLEQQVGFQHAGLMWLPFYPGPGSVGHLAPPVSASGGGTAFASTTTKARVSPSALGDTWGLVSVLACLATFNESCRQLLQVLHPLLVNIIQPKQQVHGYGQVEDLCMLLEPLAQVMQMGSRGWERQFAELLLQVLMAISKLVNKEQDLARKCRMQVLAAYIAMEDAGWAQEVATAVGGGTLIKDTLAYMKQSLLQPLRPEQAAWQVRIVYLLGLMGVDNAKRSPRTPDGLFGCLVLATIRGRQVAIDICGPEQYAANAPASTSSSGIDALAAQRRASSAAGTRSATSALDRTATLPRGAPLMYPDELGPMLPSRAAVSAASAPDGMLSPLFSQGFRDRGLSRRGWLPVLIPVWEWVHVVGAEELARRYLEAKVFAVARKGEVKERV